MLLSLLSRHALPVYMPMRRLAGAQIQSFLALRPQPLNSLSILKADKGEQKSAHGLSISPEDRQIFRMRLIITFTLTTRKQNKFYNC